MYLTLRKWGNSTALRLPATLLAQLDVSAGDSLEARISGNALTLLPQKTRFQKSPDAAIAAMTYALRAEEGMAFLQCWMHGEFDAIRK